MDWIGLFKVMSMLVAGSFGILGLATDYKDAQRKITKWGKIALGGILFSTILAMGLYGLEASKAKAAARKAEAEAKTREAEAKGFSDSLQRLMVKANEGVAKQENALDQLEDVRRKSQELFRQQTDNLQKTSEVSVGLKETLGQQNKLLQGQERSANTQLQQIKLQEKVLDESRLLYLAQYKLAGIEFSWDLSPEIVKKMKSLFDERDARTNAPKFKDAVYLQTAVSAGGNPRENYLGIKLMRDGQPKFVWSLRRPQGFRTGAFAADSLEGQAFAKVLRLARPTFFYMQIEPGTSIAELDRDLYPPELVISGSRAYFTVAGPDVKLSQLQDVVFSFQAFTYDDGTVPASLHIRLLDDKVDFESEIALKWSDCTTRKVVTYDSAEGIVYGEGVCATTPPYSANFDRLLKPLRLASNVNP